VGRGVVLPGRAVIAGLPAFDRLGLCFVAGVGSQFVFNGPAADAGAVGLEVQAAVQFAGDGALGARRFGREELGRQSDDFSGPGWMGIAAGESGRPSVGVAGSTGAEGIGVKFIEAGMRQSQFMGGGTGADLAVATTLEQMADKRCGQAFDQLWFFIGPK